MPISTIASFKLPLSKNDVLPQSLPDKLELQYLVKYVRQHRKKEKTTQYQLDNVEQIKFHKLWFQVNNTMHGALKKMHIAQAGRSKCVDPSPTHYKAKVI